MIKLKVEYGGTTIAEWHFEAQRLVAGIENNFGGEYAATGESAVLTVILPYPFNPYTPVHSTIQNNIAWVEDAWPIYQRLFDEIENEDYEK